MAHIVNFGFLLLFCFVSLVVKAYSSSDMNALDAFHQGVSDPQNAMKNWDTSLYDPCTWFHITCDNDNRVIRIEIFRYGLSGHLAPQLGNLDRLEYLNLDENNLDGPIPQELGNMANLKSLSLNGNRFSGRIPPSLGKLQLLFFLYLNNNKLTGPIPGELGDIPTLRVVDVSSNNLCGPVPRGGSLSSIAITTIQGSTNLANEALDQDSTNNLDGKD
ncbi:leucine-rich repeat protein 1-like [Impatiens glandulifera]|uniref:leucine-rich repeat protein 1-like n=1 Tax=Impatiens glandulifera TaxID=253017 RepID=UPI001FB08CCC|nr:leucine-rich repeat protein 1-like [Impatiens glandulifera]